jgi:putative flippase GtrA
MKNIAMIQIEAGSLLRFLMVGGSFSLFYAVVSAALINFAGTPPFWTSIIVFTACIMPAFFAQQHISFRVKKVRKNAFWIYAGTQFSGIALIAIFTTRFVTHIFLWDTIIMGITVGINAILSFLIGRYVTFNPPE